MGGGKIRKGRVRRLRNPEGRKYYGMVWGTYHKMFKTLGAAKRYKAGLYNRGLLFGRHVQIIEYIEGTEHSKVLFDKYYDASYPAGHGSGPKA
jgi:hypothetical protein